jgi:uncharacterized protein (DUF779 family)
MASWVRSTTILWMATHDETTIITATPEAVAALERLVVAHGPLALFQSGGCCDGSLPLCLVAGVPFYIDAEQFHRWGDPAFVLDVTRGAPEGFSLGPPDAHFITRSAACQARPA